jgi:ribosomal protein L11 methyltransferase
VRTWPALEIQQADADTRDLIQAFLTDFAVVAIDDNNPGVSVVFFHDPAERDRAANALQAQFPAVGVRAIDVPDEDWAARSQASLRAIQVGNIVVAPPWDVPEAVVGASVGAGFSRPMVITIEPSMGFGTGHHATTRLCLAALQQIDLRGRSVIDVGTGSGLLAIAGRRLGAAAVLAIDDDPDAIAAAEGNVALNRESRIALEVTDLRSSPIGQFDVVVANLTGGLLISTAPRLQSFATPGARLVLSGFMDHQERDVVSAFEGCALESRAREDEWVCAVLRRN